MAVRSQINVQVQLPSQQIVDPASLESLDDLPLAIFCHIIAPAQLPGQFVTLPQLSPQPRVVLSRQADLQVDDAPYVLTLSVRLYS